MEMKQNQVILLFIKNFLSFMTKINPNDGNETQSDFFPWVIFKSDIIFVCRKKLNNFNYFYNWHLLISLQK